jgi:1-acyl-sn-glycerol-3-phosphate acyltransferase
MAPLRRLARFAAYASVTLPLMAVQAALLSLGSPHAVRLPRLYHRLCCRLIGFRLDVRGVPSPHRPTLFVANHVSYSDIMVLGALIEGSFVAKAEIAGSPLFGQLAKLQRSVFVDRRVRTARDQRGSMAERLHRGDNLILFPEGTSSDGLRVLPFKSALLGAAHLGENRTALVQPVSIAYTGHDGLPIIRYERPAFAWYGDMDLAPHMWHLFGLGSIGVVIEFHPPLDPADFPSRKALTEHCRRVIAGAVSAALSGRLPPAPATPPAEPGRIAEPAGAIAAR